MSDDAPWPWSVLGLPKMPADMADIRRAYARALKQIDQATDIVGFEALRAAYAAATAQRNGATTRNVARKERAVEKRVEAPVMAEVVAPQVTEEQALHNLQMAAARRLLDMLEKGNLLEPASVRILNVLKDPVMQDAACRAMIRKTMAQFIKEQIAAKSYADTLPGDITREAVAALDDSFGWLSDHAAYRQDFWNDAVPLDLMAQRRYGSIKVRPPKPVPTTVLGKAQVIIETYSTLLTVIWVGCLIIFRTLDDTTRRQPIGTLLIVVLAAPLALYFLASVFLLLKKLVPQWMSISFTIWLALTVFGLSQLDPVLSGNLWRSFLAEIWLFVPPIALSIAIMLSVCRKLLRKLATWRRPIKHSADARKQ